MLERMNMNLHKREWERYYGIFDVVRDPDFRLCCVKTIDGEQCKRPAAYDNDDQNRPTHCHTHSDKMVKIRTERKKEKERQWFLETVAKNRVKEMIETLQEISKGYPQPHLLAKQCLDKIQKGVG